MRILVDVAELEQLSRLFERNTTELAGITIDLRKRLSTDLLARVAAYGLPTRGVDYEAERICDALVAHVGELERFTLDLERVWAEAKGLAQDGHLAPGVSGSASDLWWFHGGSAVPGAQGADSLAFAAAAAVPPAPPPAAVVAAVAVAGSSGADAPAGGGGTHASGASGWPALDVVVASAGLRHNPPVGGQSYRRGGTTWHGVEPGGHARDYGLIDADALAVARLFRPLAQHRPDLIPELFGADGIGHDEGSPYQAPGHTGDHTHVAIRPGVTADAILLALKNPTQK